MSPHNAVGIIWNDGAVQAAPTWPELETVVRETQWESYTPQEFRETMRFRAKNWSGTEIDITGNAQDFFCELERAGMLTTHAGNGKEIDLTPRTPRPPINLSLWRTGGRDLELLTTAMEKEA